jgi:hypothetical protein
MWVILCNENSYIIYLNIGLMVKILLFKHKGEWFEPSHLHFEFMG